MAHATQRGVWATRRNGEVYLRNYRAAGVYVNEIKPALLYLVGWFRKAGPAFMQTSDAYMLAIETIYGALPDDFTDDEIEEAWEHAHEADLDEGEEIAVAGPAADTTEPCPTDAGAWRQWLERAGFSPAEAARLVFERLRPRDEGTQRN